MSPRIPNAGRAVPRRLGKAERGIEELRKAGPDIWLYFGTYPTDTFTRADSPPFENGYARAGATFTGRDGYPRVRWDEHGRLEFAGVVEMGTDAAVMVTLPPLWLPNVDDFWTAAVRAAGTPALAQMYLEAASGEITVTLL